MSAFGQIIHLSPYWTTATIFHQIQEEDPEEDFTFLKKLIGMGAEGMKERSYFSLD